jgi:guanylate kinase
LINIDKILKENDAFFEGNTTIGRLFQTHSALSKIRKTAIFLSPLSGQEVIEMRMNGKKYFRDSIQKMMRQKLLFRLRQYGSQPDPNQMEDLEKRANDAYFELKEAHHFDYIIPNHDGEDSNNWKRPLLPSGDAGRSLDAFAAILSGKNHPKIEKWDENLVP